MELRRDGVMRWQEICVQLALGMGGLGYARIINCSQSCVPVLLTFLHKTEEQSLVLLIFFQIWNHFSVFVVVLSEGRMIYQDTITYVEVPTCCWFKRILRTLLSGTLYCGQLQRSRCVCVRACVRAYVRAYVRACVCV